MHLPTIAFALALLPATLALYSPTEYGPLNWPANDGDNCDRTGYYTCSHNVKHVVSSYLPDVKLLLILEAQ
jgi:hypothetical protein